MNPRGPTCRIWYLLNLPLGFRVASCSLCLWVFVTQKHGMLLRNRPQHLELHALLFGNSLQSYEQWRVVRWGLSSLSESLESQISCRCHFKGSTFSSVFLVGGCKWQCVQWAQMFVVKSVRTIFTLFQDSECYSVLLRRITPQEMYNDTHPMRVSHKLWVFEMHL